VLKTELPPKISGPAAWYGPDLAKSKDWLVSFSDAQVGEVETMAKTLINQGVETAAINQDNFVIPETAGVLADTVSECLHGRGFVVLRGLPAYADDIPMAAAMYYGIGAHMGRARSQNGKGHVLGHVCDLGLSTTDGSVRIYQTTERQNYHTDSCDIVGLMCLRGAKSGGLSGLVSSMTIYNEMLDARPELLAELFEPMAVDRRGEVTADGRTYYKLPVYNWHAGHLSAIYAPHYIRSATRLDGVPALSDAQNEALDLLDAMADDPRLNIEFALEPGDLLFVHNHTIMHDRTAYEEWGDLARRRHLLRLWLAIPGARPLPDVYAERYGQTTIGDRGGVIVPGVELNAPLQPV
jgi:hypothetical protein